MAPVLADDRVYRVAAAVEAALTRRRGGPILDAIRGPAGLPFRRSGTRDPEPARPTPEGAAHERAGNGQPGFLRGCRLPVRPADRPQTHVELGTVTKMFCGCPARFGGEPNSLVARSAWASPGRSR